MPYRADDTGSEKLITTVPPIAKSRFVGWVVVFGEGRESPKLACNRLREALCLAKIMHIRGIKDWIDSTGTRCLTL